MGHAQSTGFLPQFSEKGRLTPGEREFVRNERMKLETALTGSPYRYVALPDDGRHGDGRRARGDRSPESLSASACWRFTAPSNDSGPKQHPPASDSCSPGRRNGSDKHPLTRRR
jgi:hypothetical protein